MGHHARRQQQDNGSNAQMVALVQPSSQLELVPQIVPTDGGIGDYAALLSGEFLQHAADTVLEVDSLAEAL